MGHSTGGLDARLFVSPGASLGEGLELEPYARRVRTVVTVSTPHAGTPLASFFLGLFGQQILQLLSLFTVYVLRFGRLPLSVAFRLGHLLSRGGRAARLEAPPCWTSSSSSCWGTSPPSAARRWRASWATWATTPR